MSALTVFCPNCQHPNEPDFKRLINQTLGNRFHLYRQLGEGGLSTIFAAIDVQTDQTVVVKVSDPRHLTQMNFQSAAERLEARQYWTEMTERMHREVAALTHIHHPNIVRVFAAGAISDDLRYVVMELLRGRTLREELNARGALPVHEAVAIVTEAAAGLSLIHARGIVHRDLTPRNIFLCEEIADCGWRMADSSSINTPLATKRNVKEQSAIRNPPSAIVKLIDFGIAKFPKPPGAQTYTQHAVMAGTPGYASPEQFQNLAVDHRADIYSLGVVLYELVTGEKPFTGRTATEIALKQIRDEPVRPRALVPNLPLRLEALILRALAKDPLVRQQSADELAAELRTISARVEVPLVAAAALPAAPFLPTPEPSGSEVFTLLSDLVAKEAKEAKDEIPVRQPADEKPAEKLAAMEPTSLPEIEFGLPQPQRHRALVIAAGLALVFILATWLFAGRNSAPAPTPLPEKPTTNTAQPTPTLRPDVTAPRTSSRIALARQPKAEPEAIVEKVAAAPAPAATKPPAVTIPPTPASKPAPPTPRPTAPPTPEIATARPPVISPPVKVEPTPTPAPAPVRPAPSPRDDVARDNGRDNRRDDSWKRDDGWKREPVRPAPERTPDPVQPRPAATPIEPKVISWQGRVYGSREITLEMPGVPGMLDVPRNFRKKVGVVEPPSPSNGWRRAVLRVFGDGDVSLIVRWLPHHDSRLQRQEVVQWTKLK
jgi:serine/threonine-protein kinase